MADFREELRIEQVSSTSIGVYMYTWAKYDLSREDDEPIETKHGFDLSLGEACEVIDDFASGNLLTRKAKLLRFMTNDEYYDSEEY